MNPLPPPLRINLMSSPVSSTGEEGDPMRSVGGGEGPQALTQIPLTYLAKAVEDVLGVLE